MILRGFIAGFGVAICACALFRAPPSGTITFPGADRRGCPDGSLAPYPGENAIDFSDRQEGDESYLARQRYRVAKMTVNGARALEFRAPVPGVVVTSSGNIIIRGRARMIDTGAFPSSDDTDPCLLDASLFAPGGQVFCLGEPILFQMVTPP